MWARYFIDTEDWSGAESKWPAEFTDPKDRATYHFARGLAAAQRGDQSAAVTALGLLQKDRAAAKAVAERAHDTQPATIEALKRLNVLDLELQAMVNVTGGDRAAAIQLLRRAAATEDAMSYAFGPPMVDKPSHELLGEQLLLAKDPAAARVEFQKALKTMPMRPLTLRGLARAEDAANRPAEAKAAWRRLADVWHDADASLPGLAEARRKAAN
jgi:hypothetical protein